LRLRIRLNGSEFDREVEDHGRAVAILPYDPASGTVLLVRLLRAPPLLAAGVPELLEAPAGLMGKDSADDAARRELHEEVGLRVRDLEPMGTVWTMPGISTERMALYLARYSASDLVAVGGGLADEHENITVVEMPLAELWAKALQGMITDMKTLALIYMLHHRHPELFADQR
jgi:nudix-type nucleoside diphosphatase (YffH/AdpP family)